MTPKEGPPPERRASGIDRGIEGGRWQDGFRRSRQRVIALFGAARDQERSAPTQVSPARANGAASSVGLKNETVDPPRVRISAATGFVMPAGLWGTATRHQRPVQAWNATGVSVLDS